ncbi:DUF1561 family protein [Helicobacter turcicus]|uniref:DUF1561 domain-containing protein n=1 Tax=Helicobacter turcicus TaxID=2867412 RepID=A0ABS7JMX0_9HELI|nr:DUF1561 family protein [Helicobacter turcicus]MBX7490750.1 DUF1561 domain-containing protein [Helicobacter turcicus]MBX7545641.1 DUF1561 domain-containing protein [Helicobacter turcicus]
MQVFLFYVVFMLSSLLYAKTTHTPNTQTSNAQVIQKLAQPPKDKPIAITTTSSPQTQCLSPIFKDNEAYVGLSNCDKAVSARYDVFSRLAWNINHTWVCLSTPNQSYVQDTKLVLRPCVLNDNTQSWVVKNNAFYSPNLEFIAELKNGYLTLESNSLKDMHGTQKNNTTTQAKPSPTYALHSMQQWLDTIATPPTLSQKSFIAWSFITAEGFDLYYIRNDLSIKDEPQDLYFNPENGYIAQYNPANAQMLCLTSTQNKNQDWNWVSWETCNFHAQNNPANPKTWNLFMLADNNEAVLKDYLGNFLRVTKYGVHWGVPYSAKPDFLAKDMDKDQTSFFRFSNDITNWQRFLYANFSDSLPYCPAKGTFLQEIPHNTTQNGFFTSLFKNPKSLSKTPTYTEHIQNTTTLPPNFVLNEAWRKRLWQIVTTTDGVLLRAGDCGVCLLHSYQIIAEMNTYTNTPLDSGGFFFDTAFGVNPFYSFRNRYPDLARALEPYQASNIPHGLPRNTAFAYAEQMYRSIALSLFPGHFWISSDFATTDIQIRSALRDLFEQPIGTMWVMHIFFISPQGVRSGHAIPALRTNEGVQFISTNLHNVDYTTFRQDLEYSLAHNLPQALNTITQNGTLRIYMLFSLQLREVYHNPLSAFVSSNNCSGEGESRRGSGSLPISSMINQCASGRCLIQ